MDFRPHVRAIFEAIIQHSESIFCILSTFRALASFKAEIYNYSISLFSPDGFADHERGVCFVNTARASSGFYTVLLLEYKIYLAQTI